MKKPDVILLLSGGLDSTVLLRWLLHDGYQVHCLPCNYGQRHAKELRCATAICQRLKVPYTLIELARIKNLFLRCALTDGDGSVVVPNRNAVLLNIAAAMAAGMGCREVFFGATLEDYEGFPDCRPEWVEAQNAALLLAGLKVHIRVPFIRLTKREIVQLGRKLKVDFNQTWSCYAGGSKPCGKCEACKKRKAALCGR